MSLGALALVALGVVLALWALGAYNRLVAMRNDILQAWAKVQEASEQRSRAAPPLLALLRETMAAEQAALDAWVGAEALAAQATRTMSAQPLALGRAQDWSGAETALEAAANRVLALLSRQAAPTAELAQQLLQWRESQARLPFVRQLFNEAAGSYNQALSEFPTQLAARAFGLGRAGLI